MGLDWNNNNELKSKLFDKYTLNYFITSRYFIYNESALKIQRWWRTIKSQSN